MFKIKDCTNYDEAKELFVEYSKLKGAEQCFVSFDYELKNIDTIYPNGQILIATYDNIPIGCIAVKSINSTNCELKRLYLKEEFRGKGYSKVLFEGILDRAKELGFLEAEIHTLPEIMSIGYKMYLKYGFIEKTKDEGGAVFLTRNL